VNDQCRLHYGQVIRKLYKVAQLYIAVTRHYYTQRIFVYNPCEISGVLTAPLTILLLFDVHDLVRVYIIQSRFVVFLFTLSGL